MKRLPVLMLLALPVILWGFGTSEERAPGLYAEISTARGKMVFQLDYDGTPLTVTNFCGLAEGSLKNDFRNPGEPFYDGLLFYRDAPGYAVFTGDPDNSGEGGPGYTLPREDGAAFSSATPGTLLMDGFSSEASGSRFFIMKAGDAYLDSKYTPFGQLIDGKNTLKKLKKGDVLESVRITKVGAAAEALVFDREHFDLLYSQARTGELEKLSLSNPALVKALSDLGPDRIKTPSGIYYDVIRPGEGKMPVAGDKVSMHYTGKLLDGTVFDSSKTRGQTFDFVLGVDGVIPGWIEMVMGMNTGEVRMVVIPPVLAYGEQGYGPIKPNSWLVFEMELVSFVEG